MQDIVSELQASWMKHESDKKSRTSEMSYLLETLSKRLDEQEGKIASMYQDIAKIKVALCHTQMR